jgi:hypothetical protein
MVWVMIPRPPVGAILATNTSSISITKLAAQTRRPHQVIGMVRQLISGACRSAAGWSRPNFEIALSF